MSVVYRHAIYGDIPQVQLLQKANLFSEMAEDKKANGFVTTAITKQQFEELIDQQGLFVAVIGGDKVVAYVVSASWQYLSRWAIFSYMVTLFDSFTYKGEVMTLDNSYQYGPVCVDESERGKGIVEGIFSYARKAMNSRYPYGLTFVNKRNPRSLRVHVDKIGLDHICEFSFNDNQYYCLGFLTD